MPEHPGRDLGRGTTWGKSLCGFRGVDLGGSGRHTVGQWRVSLPRDYAKGPGEQTAGQVFGVPQLLKEVSLRLRAMS
jgi:hypothetical protein